MKDITINIIITVAAILISSGATFFLPNAKTKIISFGIGVTIIFWVWLLNYANHIQPPVIHNESKTESQKPQTTGIKVSGKNNYIGNNTVVGADVGYDISGESNTAVNNKYTPPGNR
jgi:hypothetical protein